MPWESLVFSGGDILTGSELNVLQGNFAAMAAGNSGSPAIVVNSLVVTGVTSLNNLNLTASSIAENGYTYLPNGVIMQWLTTESVSGVESIALPLTFPNSAFNVTATLLGDNTTRLCNINSFDVDFVEVKKFTVAEGDTAHKALIQAIGW